MTQGVQSVVGKNDTGCTVCGGEKHTGCTAGGGGKGHRMYSLWWEKRTQDVQSLVGKRTQDVQSVVGKRTQDVQSVVGGKDTECTVCGEEKGHWVYSLWWGKGHRMYSL